MFNKGLPYRDLLINKEDKPELKQAFEYIPSELISLIHYKYNTYIVRNIVVP